MILQKLIQGIKSNHGVFNFDRDYEEANRRDVDSFKKRKLTKKEEKPESTLIGYS